MKIYVAGPYSAPDEVGREQNVETAMRAGLALLKAGHAPYVPHLSHYLDVLAERVYGVRLPWEEWMRLDLAYLRVCDAVLRLPGESRGADIEVGMAQQLGIAVYTETATFAVPTGAPERFLG